MGRTPSFRPPAILGAATLAAGVFFACKAGTEPNIADISGTWQYIENVTNVPYSMSCADTGTYTLQQAGDRFVGKYFQSGKCHSPTGTVDITDSGSVTEGHVIGRSLRFRAPFCDYDGAVDTTSGSSITGHVYCVVTDPSKQLTFSGTWQANR